MVELMPTRSSQLQRSRSRGLVSDTADDHGYPLAHKFVESPQDRKVGRSPTRDVDVGNTENKRLIAFVASAVQQRCGFGIGSGDENAGNVHHVQLEASRVEPLDLLVYRDQYFATLMATFLATRFLILDVIAGDAHFDEATNQVPHVRIATVAGVCIGDDERPVVVLRCGRALLVGQSRSGELLILVGCQQCSDDGGGLVRHLA